MNKMTAQQPHVLKDVVKQEDNSLLDIDDLSLGLPPDFLRSPFAWEEIFQVFVVIRGEWIQKIDRRGEEGIRVYISSNSHERMEETVQLLRKMLERVMRTPITLYWTSTFIDFIPL